MEQVSPWLDVVFRWIHVVAGILWIGHLYFFNFVNAQLVKTYDADSKKKVVPELMPRALFWFRMGALVTWITGFLLLGIVFYMTAVGPKDADTSKHLVMAVGIGGMIVAFGVYDVLWSKTPIGKNEIVGTIVSLALLTGLAFVYDMFMSPRASFIHVGATLGTIMAANVWMRIWPAQRKIIGGIKGTSPAPDPSVPAMAGLRSKHNTYMSVGLVAMMINAHIVASGELGTLVTKSPPIAAMVFVVIGMGMAKLMYIRSASPSTAQF